MIEPVPENAFPELLTSVWIDKLEDPLILIGNGESPSPGGDAERTETLRDRVNLHQVYIKNLSKSSNCYLVTP
jgi:hypothetical protein